MCLRQVWNEKLKKKWGVNLRITYACLAPLMPTFPTYLISTGKHRGAWFASPANATSRLAPDTFLRLEWWFDIAWITVGIFVELGPRDGIFRTQLKKQKSTGMGYVMVVRLTDREDISCTEYVCIANIPSPLQQTKCCKHDSFGELSAEWSSWRDPDHQSEMEESKRPFPSA